MSSANDTAIVMTRRKLLGAMAGGAAAALLAACAPRSLLAQAPTTAPVQPRYRIGACDWMLLKRQKLGALPLAAEIGLDGVVVDLGGLGTRPDLDNKLRDPELRRQYLETARDLGLEICALAMSAFYAQDYARHPGSDRFTQEWIELMATMQVPVGFLPMGVRVNLADDAEARQLVVDRLRRFGPIAEKAGVVMGIETGMSAEDDARLLDEIGSKGVAIYYNFANAVAGGRDIPTELRTLGRERICQILCTEADGQWLADSSIDMPKVRQTLDDIGWQGWLVLERSRVAGKSVKENFSANAQYLKSIFQAEAATQG